MTPAREVTVTKRDLLVVYGAVAMNSREDIDWRAQWDDVCATAGVIGGLSEEVVEQALKVLEDTGDVYEPVLSYAKLTNMPGQGAVK